MAKAETETCDVVVTIGRARELNPITAASPITLPELRRSYDFTAQPEWTILDMPPHRVTEWRALGYDVQVTRGIDPAPKPHKPEKKDKRAGAASGEEK